MTLAIGGLLEPAELLVGQSRLGLAGAVVHEELLPECRTQLLGQGPREQIRAALAAAQER